MIRIEWPDGTVTTPKGTNMNTTIGGGEQAAAFERARVPKLRAELDALLGKKPRGAKKVTP